MIPTAFYLVLLFPPCYFIPCTLLYCNLIQCVVLLLRFPTTISFVVVIFFIWKTQLFFTMSYNAPLGFQFSLLSNQKIFFFENSHCFHVPIWRRKKVGINHDYENSCPRLLLYIFYAYYNFRKNSYAISLFPPTYICIFINFKIIPIHTDLVFSFFHIIHKCSMKQESVRQLGIFLE